MRDFEEHPTADRAQRTSDASQSDGGGQFGVDALYRPAPAEETPEAMPDTNTEVRKPLAGVGRNAGENHQIVANPEETPEANVATNPNYHSPLAGVGPSGRENPHELANPGETPAASSLAEPAEAARQEPGDCQTSGATQSANAITGPDLRFTDPLIAECVETWRLRQDMVRAQQKLTLQIKAILRRFTGGDKAEAEKLYAKITKDAVDDRMSADARLACAALLSARAPLDTQRKAFERHLTKLGKQLPIAHMADEIKGIGHLALAKIAGEAGDLSAYRSVSAVWKRMGVAVIEGERQRKKANADLAILHGYSPDRRSVLWNIAQALLKAQGKGEDAGPYRLEYDRVKAREIDEKGQTLIVAHNRAMRKMSKSLLKDLTVEWRKVARGDLTSGDTHPTPVAPQLIAAE